MTKSSEPKLGPTALGVEVESRIGTTIEGGWRLSRVLGVGGVATVYAATHPCRRVAAMKILHRRHAQDEAIRRRFFGERGIIARIRHEACVTILGSSETDDGVPLLVMELLAGDTLEVARVRVGTLPLSHALYIAERILDFLVACHAAGVIHRDLKPDNVFLTCDGRVKVIDFGVAHVAGLDRVDPRTVLGTPEFMSPEQARAEPAQVRETSDLFAVGAILFTMLTGSLVRSGRDAHDTLRIAAFEPPRSVALVAPTVPSDVAALVDRALAWHPADRWSSACEMRDATHRLLTELEATSAPAPSPMRISDATTRAPESLRPTFPSSPGVALGASACEVPTFTERSDEAQRNSQARMKAVAAGSDTNTES